MTTRNVLATNVKLTFSVCIGSWKEGEVEYFKYFCKKKSPGWPSPTDSDVNKILSLLEVSEKALPVSAEGILKRHN